MSQILIVLHATYYMYCIFCVRCWLLIALCSTSKNDRLLGQAVEAWFKQFLKEKQVLKEEQVI